MKNSVLIVGMGKFGQYLAEKMKELGNDLLVVDKSEETIDLVSPLYDNAIVANCTNELVIQSLGVSNFDYCIVAISDDFQASLEITNLLKENGAKHVIAKAERDIQEKFLLRNGADEVIFPDKDVAIKLAVKCTEDIFDYIDLGDEYAIFEIAVPRLWIKKTIKGLNVRPAYNINILGIKQGNTLNALPGPGYVFKENDHVLILGKVNDVFKITDADSIRKTMKKLKREQLRKHLSKTSNTPATNSNSNNVQTANAEKAKPKATKSKIAKPKVAKPQNKTNK